MDALPWADIEKQARGLLLSKQRSNASTKLATAAFESAAGRPIGSCVAARRAVLLSWLAWVLHGDGHYTSVMHDMDMDYKWCSKPIMLIARDMAMVGAAVKAWVRRVCMCDFGVVRSPSVRDTAGMLRRSKSDVRAMLASAHTTQQPVRVLYNVFPEHLVTAWVKGGLEAFFLEDVPALPKDTSASGNAGAFFVRVASFAALLVLDDMLEFGCRKWEDESRLLVSLLQTLQAVPLSPILALCVLHLVERRRFLFHPIATEMQPSWVVEALRKVADFRRKRWHCDHGGRGLAALEVYMPTEEVEATGLYRFLTVLVLGRVGSSKVDTLVHCGLGDVCVEALSTGAWQYPTANAFLDMCLVVGVMHGDLLARPAALWHALTQAETSYFHAPAGFRDTCVQNRYFAAAGQREAASDLFFCIATRQQRWVRRGRRAWVLVFTQAVTDATAGRGPSGSLHRRRKRLRVC
jgi:hypothetical protein